MSKRLKVCSRSVPTGSCRAWPASGSAIAPRSHDHLPIEEKESYRWLEALENTTAVIGDTQIDTVCDREADLYDFFKRSHQIGAPLHPLKATRTEQFRHMLRAARLLRKYHAPFMITSGALSAWDLRAPSELIAFGHALGFDQETVKRAQTMHWLTENRKRLGNKWILPGLELR